MPRFQDRDRRTQSIEWAAANSDQLIGALAKGIESTMAKHKHRLG
jgi:hypothetical protein